MHRAIFARRLTFLPGGSLYIVERMCSGVMFARNTRGVIQGVELRSICPGIDGFDGQMRAIGEC